VQTAERRDAYRLGAAVAAAILVHAGLVFAIPFLTSLDTASLPDYGPIVVTLEEPLPALEPPAPPPEPEIAPAPKPEPAAPVAAAKPAPAPTPVPAKPATAAAAPATTAEVPRAPHQSFTKAGGLTGTSAGPATEPANRPNIVLPRDLNTRSAPGSGEQHGGDAVATSAKPAGSGSSLKSATEKLDKSLAGAATTGTTGAAAASMSGSAAARGIGDIVWDNPEAARDRKLLAWPDPRLPETVKRAGLVLTVRVEFSVDANGLVTSRKVVEGSGDPEFDAACFEALGGVKFSSSAGARVITGQRTIRITLR
jgi:TonB family protein